MAAGTWQNAAAFARIVLEMPGIIMYTVSN